MPITISKSNSLSLIHDPESALLIIVWRQFHPNDWEMDLKEAFIFVKQHEVSGVAFNTGSISMDAERLVLNKHILQTFQDFGVRKIALLTSVHFNVQDHFLFGDIQIPIANFKNLPSAVDWLQYEVVTK